MVWPFTSSQAAPAQGGAASLPPQTIKTSSEPLPTPQNTPSSKPLSRDEIAEQELQSFLQEIAADTKPSSTKYSRIPKAAPSSASNSSATDDESRLPLRDQLLPTTMSCRDAFDAAFYCNSMGGQFNNLYRYGTVRSCSESWNDFWFCMRTRTWSENEKGEAIRSRYRDKEQAKYSKQDKDDIGRSSEDVWRSRDKKIEPGEAMSKPFLGFPSDEEFNRIVREERKRVHGNTE